MTQEELDHLLDKKREDKHPIEITDQTFTGQIRLRFAVNLHFDRCIFDDLVTYSLGNNSNFAIILNSCSVKGELMGNKGPQIRISNSDINLLNLRGAPCHVLKTKVIKMFSEGTHTPSLHCIECKIDTLLFRGVTFDSGNFMNCTFIKDVIITAGNSLHFKFQFSTIFHGSVMISTQGALKLVIEDCKFLSQTKQEFVIHSDDISGVELTNISLEKIYLFLYGIKDFMFTYQNVLFPKAIHFYKNSDINWQYLSTIFRKMKHNFEEKKDHIQARIFASMELESHYLYLTQDKKEKWFNHFPLYTSKVSNDFGRNWIKPLIFFLGTSFILLIALGYSMELDFSSIPDLLVSGDYFIFLLPTHDLNMFDKYQPTYIGTVATIDFFQRLVSGFFIFQFIRAFRFHVAK